MKKYDQLITKLTEEINNELEMGIKVEAEHQDLYNFFSNFCKANNLRMPLTEERFYELIAKAHLREIKNYYTLLQQMENSAKTQK
jgi:hypothetical protein